jgi:hypothetical protein
MASRWMTCTRPPTSRNSQTCPFKMTRGSSDTPKIRSLPSRGGDDQCAFIPFRGANLRLHGACRVS